MEKIYHQLKLFLSPWCKIKPPNDLEALFYSLVAKNCSICCRFWNTQKSSFFPSKKSVGVHWIPRASPSAISASTFERYFSVVRHSENIVWSIHTSFARVTRSSSETVAPDFSSSRLYKAFLYSLYFPWSSAQRAARASRYAFLWIVVRGYCLYTIVRRPEAAYDSRIGMTELANRIHAGHWKSAKSVAVCCPEPYWTPVFRRISWETWILFWPDNEVVTGVWFPGVTTGEHDARNTITGKIKRRFFITQ